MKSRVLSFILLLSVFCFSNCKKEKNDQPKDTYEVNTNPLSSHIMKVTKSDGTVVNYFGKKKANGETESIQAVKIQEEGIPNPTMIFLNEQQEIQQLFDTDGNNYRLDWSSETTFRLTATTADNLHQISLPIDLENLEESNQPFQAPPTGQFENVREHKSLNLTVEDNFQPSAGNRDNDRTLTVNYTQCGEPIPSDDLPIFLTAEFCDGNVCEGAEVLTPKFGTFEYKVPEHGPGLPADIADLCNSIESGLGNVCTAMSVFDEARITAMCVQLAAAVEAVLVPIVGEGVIVFGLCETTLLTIKTLCLFVDGPNGGGPGLMAEFCKWIKELESDLVPTTIRLNTFPHTPENGFVEIPYNGPFGEIDIELEGGEATVESFRTNPVDPAPFQGYVASAEVFCAAGKPVTISVEGTDGYMDSATIVPQGNITIYLQVPGAVDGVRDVLKVEIEDRPTVISSIIF